MIYSPLRYPGGKGKITPLIEYLIKKQGIDGGTYIEPFAGGAGVALELLCKGIVRTIVINDYDKGIYSFWRALLTESERFVEAVNTARLNVDEWKYQKEIVSKKYDKYSFELGFATFYLNRTNRSGIIKGGVIGGINQLGSWKLDARFNKETLINRMNEIIKRRNSIKIYNKDICSFITNYIPKYEKKSFIYFDPPYFSKGKQLYLNFFDYDDHVRIEKTIRENVNCNWIITYDCAPEIIKIYENHALRMFDLKYSAANNYKASELMIFKNENMIPNKVTLEKCFFDINMRSV